MGHGSRGGSECSIGAREIARVAILVALLVAAPPGGLRADDEPAPAAETEAPVVGIDKLLQLPPGFGIDEEPRRGASPAAWRERFESARKGLEDAKQALAKIEKELDEASDGSSAWQVSAPGASDPQTSPLSLRLRQEAKEKRRAIQEAERSLRALEVEADLASVPIEWRH